MKRNLKGVRFKGIIATFQSNIKYKAEKILKGIPKCFLQSQFLPKEYHDQIPGHLRHRKLESERSVKLIKRALLSFFRRIGLLPVVPTYIRSSTRRVPYFRLFVNEDGEFMMSEVKNQVYEGHLRSLISIFSYSKPKSIDLSHNINHTVFLIKNRGDVW